MKQAINLTGKGVTSKKAPKTKASGPLTQEKRGRASSLEQLGPYI